MSGSYLDYYNEFDRITHMHAQMSVLLAVLGRVLSNKDPEVIAVVEEIEAYGRAELARLKKQAEDRGIAINNPGSRKERVRLG